MTKSKGIGRGGARKGAGCKPKVLPPSKVFENYRYHPALQYDSLKLVFKLGKKVYLIDDKTAHQIIPKSVTQTNIGDPYKDLARLDFVFANNPNDKYGECVDFDINLKEDLKTLLQ